MARSSPGGQGNAAFKAQGGSCAQDRFIPRLHSLASFHRLVLQHRERKEHGQHRAGEPKHLSSAINTYQECPGAPPVTNCPSGRRPCPGKSRLQQAGTGPRLVGHKVPAAASSGASLAATGILAVQSYQSNTASHGSSNTIVTSTRSSPLPSFTSILRMIRSGVIFPPAHTPGCLFPAGNNPQAPQNPGYPRCKQQMEPTPPLRIPATLPSCSQQPVWVRAQQRGCSSRLSSASRNPINC